MTPPDRNDPLLDEVRRNRERLLRTCGGSLDSLYELLAHGEAKETRPVVKLPRRPEGPTDTRRA